MRESQKGFSLVELAGALIIIGLLIGGVLAGQSMISTSKVNAMAMQLGQFDAGVENFKTKFNYLPGDAPAFGGNGDGAIGMYPTRGANMNWFFDCEIGNFWYSIDSTQFTGAACNGTAGTMPIASGPGQNVPASKLGISGSLVIASGIGQSYTNNNIDLTNPRNYYAIFNPAAISPLLYGAYHGAFITTTTSNSAVKPVDLLALDQKIDDGVGTTGNVLSGSIGNDSGGHPGINATALTACSSAGGVYNLSNTGYTCTPLIRIGGSVNDPQ
jgi:hypothetical protein